MAVSEQEIRQRLAEHYGQKPVTVLGKVVSVDKAERTCTVDDDGSLMYGVRLQCITEGESGVLVTPKVGAMVLAVDIEGTGDYMVVQASEVEWIEVVLDGYKITADKDEVVFHEGTDGMVKVADMVSWMNKVHDDLTTLTRLLSSSPVAGNGNPLGITFTPTTPVVTKSDFEDVKIKH